MSSLDHGLTSHKEARLPPNAQAAPGPPQRALLGRCCACPGSHSGNSPTEELGQLGL